mmetsp:Transcript_32124/g.63985  ORF Transcript_32124/g.63985 Transcript_32124/m.63985 type:complete len:839 (+) Transcript_32124:2-2518(+)
MFYQATRKLLLPKPSTVSSPLLATWPSSDRSVTLCEQRNSTCCPAPTANLYSRIKNNGHQRGHGKLVALSSKTSNYIRTHLSELHHSSPMRLVPSRRTHPTKIFDPAYSLNGRNPKEETIRQEAALVHLSSYGGGLVPGDSLDLEIEVRGKGAVLCVLTQGGQRIYRPGKHFRHHANWSYHDGGEIRNDSQKSDETGNSCVTLCKSSVHCTIEPGATLLYLPDPTVPYYQSSFQETRKFLCQFSDIELGNTEDNIGSLIAVDWYSCGRRFSTGMETEQWAFDNLATRTELFVERQNMNESKSNSNKTPTLIESMSLRNRFHSKKSGSTPAALSMGQNHDAVATLLLHGPASQSVAKRVNSLSRFFAAMRTRIRQDDFQHNNCYFDSSDDSSSDEPVGEMENLRQSLGGDVILSISSINTLAGEELHGEFIDEEEESQTHLVRILAESNEDIYRILHHCLKPCCQLLSGFEPYKDRIHSSKTVRRLPVSLAQQKSTDGVQNKKTKMQDRTKSDLDQIANKLVFGNNFHSTNLMENAKDNVWFRMSMLSDSALPVGSFAHSLGVEAASQMRFFDHAHLTNEGFARRPPWTTNDDTTSTCSVEALSNYVYAASRSNAQLSTPFILAGYHLLAPSPNQKSPFKYIPDFDQILESWDNIDKYLDSMLLGNGPGRRASMDQGLGLLRISSTFIDHSERSLFQLWELMRKIIDQHHIESFSSVDSFKPHGHAFPIYGMMSASMGLSPLDSCRMYSFGAARDAVSAAVRLNLIGPMAGLALLDDAGFVGVNEGLEAGLLGMLSGKEKDGNEEEKIVNWLKSAATCAPMMDAVQPCHDMLSVRLFRT